MGAELDCRGDSTEWWSWTVVALGILEGDFDAYWSDELRVVRSVSVCVCVHVCVCVCVCVSVCVCVCGCV